MGRKLSKFLYIVMALPILYVYSLLAGPTDAYLNSVNNVSGTDQGCKLCHIDPEGRGPLTIQGRSFVEAGHDPNYFRPSSDL